MSFSAADLVATIRLDGVEKVGRDLGTTRRQLEGVDRAASKVGKAAEAAFKGASVGIGAASIAAGVMVTKLFSAGVGYNTLQQTSRAALKTILDGADQANAQMDKLDAFARNSPFSKSVFITAQQQLLGFGMEAEKVLPTLDAIQQAVAATGGSSAQIGEIAFVLAQIQSAGKITGQDLLQLGQRGINAADLIGAQMGKTGAEIKDSITKGALDAGDALDALTKGMAEKFAGASANVKATFSGTVDRIRAASRDIGAALAEPFVSAHGGGLAVTWGNQIADVMRAVESHVSPTVSMLTQRAAPAFADITRLLDRTNVQIRAWDSTKMERGLDTVAAHLPAIAGVAGAVLGVNTQLLRGIPVLGSFIPAISPLGGILAGIALASPEVRASIGDLVDEFKPLLPVVVEISGVLSGALNAALPVVAGGIQGLVAVARPLLSLLTSIPAPVTASILTFLALNKVTSGLKPVLGTVLDGFNTVRETIAASVGMSQSMGGSVSIMGATMSAAGVAATGMGDKIKAAFIGNPVGLALMVISGAVAAWAGANAEAQARVEAHRTRVAELRGTLDEATGATTNATRAMVAEKVATDEITNAAKSAGINTTLLTDALTGVEGAAGSAEKAILDSAKAQLEGTDASAKAEAFAKQLGVSYDTLVKSALYNKDAHKEVQAAIAGSGQMQFSYASTVGDVEKAVQRQTTSQVALMRALEAGRAELEQAQDEQRAFRNAVAESAAAMSDSARNNQKMNDALAIARDTSKDATERINALRQALDLLNGGTRTAAETQEYMAGKSLDLLDALSQTNTEGVKLSDTWLDQAGAISETDRAGLSFIGQLRGMSDEMLTAQQAAYDLARSQGKELPEAQAAATAAGDAFLDTLRGTFEQADLTGEQINALIGKYFEVPAVTAALITDNGTVGETEANVLRLIGELHKVPGTTEMLITDPLSADVIKRLADIGYGVENLEDGTIKVTLNGVDTAETALTNLSRTRTANITARFNTQQAPDAGWSIKAPGSANGNLYAGGKPQAFANGGFPSGIYRGRPGGIHKFAEPETGWEAYVSGKPGQEERNRRILSDAAVRLGGMATFANGGMVSTFANGGLTDAQRERERLIEWLRTQTIDWRTDERRGTSRSAAMGGNALSVVDKLMDIALQIGGATGDALYATAVRSEQAFMGLEKEASSAEKQLTTVTDRLNGLKDAAASMAASVATSIRRFFNIGDAATAESKTITTKVGEGRDAFWETNQVTQPVSADSVKDYFASKASGIKAFAEKLVQLQKKGITGALLAEIAELGVENGTPIADALLSATVTDIDSINASYGQIQEHADKGGATVSDSNFKALISAAEQQVKAAQTNSDAIEQRLRQETDRLIGAITGGLTTQVRAYGGITPMANGGIRDAMIAPAGSNILWAEDDTGGEAYIPFALDRRTRALEIHEEAGRRLGVASNDAHAVDQRRIDNSVTTHVTYKAAPAAKPISDQRQLRQTVNRLRLATRR